MHPMPSAEVLQSLLGEELGQVSLEPFGVRFVFDRWGLSVQCNIEHVEPTGARHIHDCTTLGGPPLVLHRLLQKLVTSVEREELAFKLHFTDGSTLIVHTEIGPFECGQLYRVDGTGDFTVF